jgi:hypothetical protein
MCYMFRVFAYTPVEHNGVLCTNVCVYVSMCVRAGVRE